MTIIKPMLAKAGSLPTTQDQAEYSFEIKWDGVRALFYLVKNNFKLLSRNQKDITPQYPELTSLAATLKPKYTELILDGEIVAFNADGLPSFSLLQHRMGLKGNLVNKRMHVIPVSYIIFDLLQLDNDSFLDKPYYERRAILDSLVLEGPYWQTPAIKTGEGATILAATRHLGLEGIIAKRLNSIYQPGKRSEAWLKIKNQRRQELVIGGWIPGQGARKNQIGALLLGYYQHLPQTEPANGKSQQLMYAGRAGTGFTQSMLINLAQLLTPLTRSATPFANNPDIKNARFVQPQLVGEFEFTEWTPNHTLRHPVFKGLRNDKDPLQVIREK